jgi:hypothetical protein
MVQQISHIFTSIVTESGNGPAFSKTPVPTPFCSVTLPRRKPSRLAARDAVAGT